MNVRKEDSPADPAYPDAKEFLKNRAAFGAAILGAGMALGACADKGRTGGVPIRTGGVVAVPDGAKESGLGNPKDWKGARAKENDEPTRLLGDIPAEPKSDPPRLPGKAKIEPPPVPGSPPVTPPNPEY